MKTFLWDFGPYCYDIMIMSPTVAVEFSNFGGPLQIVASIFSS